MDDRAADALIAEEDREWVRALVAEHGLTKDVEVEARRRVNPDLMEDIAVRLSVAAILGGILALIPWVLGADWWVYLFIIPVAIAISK